MYNNFNQGYNNSMVYNQNLTQPVMTNALTKEELEILRKTNQVSSIPQVTTREVLQSKCSHRDESRNTFATSEPDAEGYVTCNLCGLKFRPVEYSTQQVQAATDDMIDIIETTKYNYLDMPKDTIQQYFKMTPLIRRLPALYDQSCQIVSKYDQGLTLQQSSNGNYMQFLNAITSGGAMGIPYYGQQPYPNQGQPYPNQGQPYPNQQYAQPPYPNQGQYIDPNQAAMMAQAQAMQGGNPLYTNQSQAVMYQNNQPNGGVTLPPQQQPAQEQAAVKPQVETVLGV